MDALVGGVSALGGLFGGKRKRKAARIQAKAQVQAAQEQAKAAREMAKAKILENVMALKSQQLQAQLAAAKGKQRQKLVLTLGFFALLGMGGFLAFRYMNKRKKQAGTSNQKHGNDAHRKL